MSDAAFKFTKSIFSTSVLAFVEIYPVLSE